ncbi:MAG: hypothetical protein Q8Q04_00920 [archaeon]|nr:hypothetical protein [archaeon]
MESHSKKIDKEVLRWYTKVGTDLEKKGKNINKINLSLTGVYLPLMGINPGGFYLDTVLTGMDYSSNFINYFLPKEEVISKTTAKKSPFEIYEKITNSFRLPILAWGTINTIKGISDLYSYFAHGESPNWSETAFNFSTGIEHLALASSIYLKARDPKLLDKAPAWKDMLNKSKNKLEEIVSPVPKPVPVEATKYSMGELK